MKYNKTTVEKFLKIVLYIFLIIQPFLDTYYLYTDNIINIFKFSPSTIIRFSMIGLLLIYEIKKYLTDKKVIPFFITIIVTVFYIILHHLAVVNFNSVDKNNFSYSFIQDTFYIARLTLPIFIMFIVNDFKITFSEMVNIIQISTFIICFIIVMSNLLTIGLSSYNNKVIADNIIGWFTGAYNSYSYLSLATKGWFNFANQIAALIIIFLPFNIYSLFKKTSFFNFTIMLLSLLSALMLGTRVALYGYIGIFFISLFIYLFDILINKKHINLNKGALLVSLLLLSLYIYMYPYSPANNRKSMTENLISLETEKQESNTLIGDEEITISELNTSLKNVKNSDDINLKIDFIGKYYNYYRINSHFIENSYSYKSDPDFWLDIMELPIENRLDYRFLEQSIIERVSTINNNKLSMLFFGISYSRVQNIFNIERDFVLQYYTLGIAGLIVFFIIPFILFPIAFALRIIKNKKINIENILLLLSIFLFLGIGLCSGNIIDALTVTIYIGLILGVMFFNYININNSHKIKSKKKITIVALHLGFGGVENSICSLANMLCDYYDVEIISTYKLLDKPAFELDSKIKVKYLIENLTPNRVELATALKNKNIINIIKEINKSVKILYLKKYRLIKYIKKIDSDVIISTRDIHNKWVGKYANKDIIKIAEEHNHHNNDKKYINKLLKSLKHIHYLMPVSKELTEFYKEKLKNSKTRVIYIPHALDIFPDEVSNLETQNIISIGRLSKEKGFYDLIKVFKELHKKNDKCKLRIIGDGPEREPLNSLILKENLSNYIELCGFKNKDELSKLMLSSSLYLMASYTESFGLVLLEAESYGIPIIAFDSAQGASEIIKNGENGFLISQRDIDEMAQKSYILLNDLDLRKKLGQSGRKYAEFHKKENIQKMWIDFIDKI